MSLRVPWIGELRLDPAELGALGVLVALLALGLLLHFLAFRVLRRVFPPAEVPAAAETLRTGVAPLRWLVLRASGLWDGRVWNLQVTDARERTVELRALVSAADSAAAWDLRCQVREKLIEYLQRNHPEALPRFRVETGGPAAETAQNESRRPDRGREER